MAIREAIRDTAKNILNCKRVEELKENIRISKGWLYKQEKRCNIGERCNAYSGENGLSVWGRKTVNRKKIKGGAATEICGCSTKKICYNKIRERRIKWYVRKQENKNRCNPERFLETK